MTTMFTIDAQIADSTKRLVKLEGSVNCRDLGGYKTKDGTSVKWGKIYRGADISKLTDADLEEFRLRHIYTIVDFRDNQEVKAAPDRLLPNADYLLCANGMGNTNGFADLAAGFTSGKAIMNAFYANTGILEEKYKPFFEKLLSLPDSSALLFHCTAGKDRTGIAAALFLYALDVPMDTILEDYTATNVYRAGANAPMIEMMVATFKIDKEMATEIMSVYPEYIESTFNAIKNKSGSVDAFLENNLGLIPEKRAMLKEKFTE